MGVINKVTAQLVTAVALLTLACASQAGQYNRQIYINGERLDALGIAAVDRLSCGNTVPNGRYWLNLKTGAWGYEGGPMEGLIGNCQAAEPEAKSGYIEDRIFEQSGISIIQSPVYSQ